ncbi:hypothetical protein DXN04_18730 [Chitinophaga silvisoli]|uniref:Uncharacterized protein n=1 Tax=Chitinophaga silvisoli TaxID=2291814 RepID=A0A3E1P1G4_9BACT|nr:hypothetical protein DXN04_18730 [Chitinophaga silvisoli]
MRRKLVRHYQQLRLGEEEINADMVKQAFFNKDKPVDQLLLMWLINHHEKLLHYREILTIIHKKTVRHQRFASQKVNI